MNNVNVPQLILLVIVWQFTVIQSVQDGCELEIIVDPFLTTHFEESGYNVKQKIVRRVIDVVQFTNEILRKTQLDSKISYQLVIKRLKVLNFGNCNYNDVDYCDSSLNSASDLLQRHSESNHSDVCLSYLFTYRDFPDSTTGLAWTATKGGVCSATLNTGLLSFFLNGEEISQEVAAIAFAHEIGHSFGSQHDSNTRCMRSVDGWHYLMHKSLAMGSTSGLLHPEFSECSIHNMTRALREILFFQNRNCLVEKSICGNGIVEGWEECDCGETDEDCEDDPCCHPGLTINKCTLTPESKCSPSEGTCCSQSCSFLPRGDICSKKTPCAKESRCTGSLPQCPTPKIEPDGTFCADYDNATVCDNGRCLGSVCSNFGMIPCTPKDDEKVWNTQCEVHCRHINNKLCHSTSKLTSVFKSPIFYPINSRCDLPGGSLENISSPMGFCSETGECVQLLKSETPSTAVGLIIFIVAYLIILIVGLWVYHKYFKKNFQSQTHLRSPISFTSSGTPN